MSSASPSAAGRCPAGRSGDPDRERETDQPLLRAVVEVSFEARAFPVGRLDDPGARRADVGQAGARLGEQPLVLQGEAGGRGDLGHPVRVLLQPGPVLDHRDDLPVADERRRAPVRTAGQHAAAPLAPTSRPSPAG